MGGDFLDEPLSIAVGGPGGGGVLFRSSNSHFKFLGAETDGVTIDFNNIADALVNFA
jgi:hypothetical protein